MIPGAIIFWAGHHYKSTGLMWVGGLWFALSLGWFVWKMGQRNMPTTVPIK